MKKNKTPNIFLTLLSFSIFGGISLFNIGISLPEIIQKFSREKEPPITTSEENTTSTTTNPPSTQETTTEPPPIYPPDPQQIVVYVTIPSEKITSDNAVVRTITPQKQDTTSSYDIKPVVQYDQSAQDTRPDTDSTEEIYDFSTDNPNTTNINFYGDSEDMSFSADYEEIYNDDSANTNYEINIDSSGQLILVAADQINQIGDVNILYTDSSETEYEEISTYSLSEILNTSNSDEQQTKCINVNPGTYLFECTNCDLEDVDFYQVGDIEELANTDELFDNTDGDFFDNDVNDKSDSDIFHNDEISTEYISLPMYEEIVCIPMQPETFLYNVELSPQYDFVPKIAFWSEENIDGILRILDENRQELFSINSSQADADNKEFVDCDFYFVPGLKYYVEITTFQEIELPEYVYYFQIAEADSDD